MQGLQVDINHLNPGVRYKFITNDGYFNPGNIFSGDYNRSILTHDTPPQRYLEFANCINETNGIGQGTMSIPVNFIREIYAVVSAPSEKKLPADIGREINSYGGRINRRRKINKTRKQKRKTRKQKRKTRKQKC